MNLKLFLAVQKRCNEVSPRFDASDKNGSLEYLTNGRINNQKVICTASEPGGDCDSLLYTLESKENELQALNQLNDILQGRATIPREEETEELLHPDGTFKVYLELDIETFLRTAPVEPE